MNAPGRQSGTGSPRAETGGARCVVTAAETAADTIGTLTPRPGAFVCSACGAAREGTRLPPGWKRTPDDVPYCGACWRTRYVQRCISVPVIPADEALWREMRACWRMSRRAANHHVRDLFVADDFGQGDVVKLPRWGTDPARDKRLYESLRTFAPDYTTVSSAALMHWVRTAYMARRWDLFVGKVSLPSYRSVPWMVRRSGWRLSDDGGAVTITLLTQRPMLTLAPGPDFAPQRAILARVASGELLAGDAKLCEQGKRIMFRAAVWVPVQRREGVQVGTQLVVATDDSALLTFSIAGRRAMKPLYMRHILGAIKRHDLWRQEVACDTKFEKRWPSDVRRNMNGALGRRCQRANDRIKTACQQVAAMIAGYAARQRVEKIVLDFSAKSFAAHFPWAQLASNISNAAELRGIGCVRQSDAL